MCNYEMEFATPYVCSKEAMEEARERVEEALAMKHCALSLVGEPIMYPHIDKFIDLLHA